ncbi:MAG: AbrB/MazE/SpoVT family DNA-binding domain-containing protein [Bifidobacteriaceae bacterium]|jgi:bifunctional DNA-binding transcriptional regulator/antitoxin component of YhaV-PrlF toxin-antitoxin module|nr:AbrB/MazE/SpoVT family DNA-binding domain-containing protein [Bifidobacteriaceae bacterium]
MSDTTAMVVGQKGRVVIPGSARSRHGWGEGTQLIGFDREDGFVLMSREAALKSIRRQLAASPVVDQLISERRAEARRERDAS